MTFFAKWWKCSWSADQNKHLRLFRCRSKCCWQRNDIEYFSLMKSAILYPASGQITKVITLEKKHFSVSSPWCLRFNLLLALRILTCTFSNELCSKFCFGVQLDFCRGHSWCAIDKVDLLTQTSSSLTQGGGVTCFSLFIHPDLWSQITESQCCAPSGLVSLPSNCLRLTHSNKHITSCFKVAAFIIYEAKMFL